MISDAASLLCDDTAKDFQILLEIFLAANGVWLEPNKYIPRNHPPTPFHVLFQSHEEDVADFTARLKHTGVEFEILPQKAEIGQGVQPV